MHATSYQLNHNARSKGKNLMYKQANKQDTNTTQQATRIVTTTLRWMLRQIGLVCRMLHPQALCAETHKRGSPVHSSLRLANSPSHIFTQFVLIASVGGAQHWLDISCCVYEHTNLLLDKSSVHLESF